MAIALLEPGTYRTHSGKLVHCRPCADGSIRSDHEDGTRAAPGELVVKLSDDPDWPDAPRVAEPLLFAD